MVHILSFLGLLLLGATEYPGGYSIAGASDGRVSGRLLRCRSVRGRVSGWLLRCRSVGWSSIRVVTPLPERPRPSIRVVTPLPERPRSSIRAVTPLPERPWSNIRVVTPLPRHRRCPARGREKGGRRPFAVASGAALRGLSLASQSVRHLVSSGFHWMVKVMLWIPYTSFCMVTLSASPVQVSL